MQKHIFSATRAFLLRAIYTTPGLEAKAFLGCPDILTSFWSAFCDTPAYWLAGLDFPQNRYPLVYEYFCNTIPTKSKSIFIQRFVVLVPLIGKGPTYQTKGQQAWAGTKTNTYKAFPGPDASQPGHSHSARRRCTIQPYPVYPGFLTP